MDDLILNVPGDAILIHSLPQLHFDFFHAFLGSLEAERAAQLFRFAAAESGGDHRHTQQLFLKQRYTQCPFEYRLERRMRVTDSLASLPSLQIRMDHVADNRSGPDDGNLNDDVVETLWTHSRQARHLRAAFDLKHSDRVCFLHGRG